MCFAIRGVTKEGTIPRAPKSPNNVTCTFFNTVHLLLEDLRFENGGAKVASCPGRHLTTLRPCLVWTLSISSHTEQLLTKIWSFENLNFNVRINTFFNSLLLTIELTYCLWRENSNGTE